MTSQVLQEREHIPDFDQFDTVALREFVKNIPEGQMRSLTINHVQLMANSGDTAQGLIDQYRAYKAGKQSS